MGGMHERNYRMVLPLGVIFALASVASAVIFIVYAVEWAENDSVSTHDNDEQRNRLHKVEYAYYATVLSLLTMIVFFNGYHLTKMRS